MLIVGVPVAPEPPARVGTVVNSRLLLPTPGVLPRPEPRTNRMPLLLLDWMGVPVRAETARVVAPPPGVKVIVFVVNELRVRLPTASVTPPLADPIRFRLPPPKVRVASRRRLETGVAALSSVTVPPVTADVTANGRAPLPFRVRVPSATTIWPAYGWDE